MGEDIIQRRKHSDRTNMIERPYSECILVLAARPAVLSSLAVVLALKPLPTASCASHNNQPYSHGHGTDHACAIKRRQRHQIDMLTPFTELQNRVFGGKITEKPFPETAADV